MNSKVAVVGLCAVLAGCGGGTSAPSATYSAEIVSIDPINPATVTVISTVENTSDTAGTPSCTVRVTDPGGAYTGFDGVSLVDPVEPGDTAKFKADIVVTNEGAEYVTEGSIECT